MINIFQSKLFSDFSSSFICIIARNRDLQKSENTFVENCQVLVNKKINLQILRECLIFKKMLQIKPPKFKEFQPLKQPTILLVQLNSNNNSSITHNFRINPTTSTLFCLHKIYLLSEYFIFKQMIQIKPQELDNFNQLA